MNELLPVVVNALGRALLHSIWQGSLVALGLALFLSLIGSNHIRARYLASYLALIVCMGLFVNEFCLRVFTPFAEKIVPTLNQTITSQVWVSNDLLSLSSWLETRMEMIVIVWLSCVILLALRMCAGLLWIDSYTQRNRSMAHPLWQARVNRMAEQFQIQGKVLLRVVDDLHSPLAVGVLRPMILMPGAMLTGMPTDLLEMLLAHEMAHIKRHDYLLNLIQSLIEMILFYHPAVWWISRQIRNNREEIADDLAARVTGEPRRLALALSELANFQFITPQLAQAAHGGNLMSRIKRLVKPEVRTANWKATFLILGLVSSSLTLFAHANVSSASGAKETGTAKEASAAKQLYRDDEKKGDKKPVIDFAKCRPMYPRESLNKKETGRVQLAVLIGADGDILNAKVERSTGHRMLDNAVVDALKTCKEKAIPGKINGEYAQIWTKVQFVWKLE